MTWHYYSQTLHNSSYCAYCPTFLLITNTYTVTACTFGVKVASADGLLRYDVMHSVVLKYITQCWRRSARMHDLSLPSHCQTFPSGMCWIFTHTATSMKDLFDNTDNQLIVDFIKDIYFYHCVPGEPKKIPPTTFVDITAMHGNFCTKFYTIVKRSNIRFITKFYWNISGIDKATQF